MPANARAAAAVLAACAAVALGGCGEDAAETGADSGARSAYEEALSTYFAEEIPATDAYEAEAAEAEEAGDLEGFADVLEAGLDGSDRRFAAFLASADPPAEIEDVHDDLVETITIELELGDEYVTAARAGDEDRIEELDEQLEPVLERFDDLRRRFDDAGYEVELPEP